LAQANTAAGLGGLGKFTELRQRLLFVLLALVVYRIGCYIPVPGVDPERLLELMNSQKGTIADMFNMFSGGALQRFSLFTLNVVPYISASIIVQLMGQIYGPWKAMKNEGESGRRKLTQYSRMGAVGLAIIQSFFLARGLQSQGVSYDTGPGFLLTATVALTTGTIFLMWLGEQITERGIGNGVSLIIFAGIVSGLPAAAYNTLTQVATGDMNILTLLGILALVLGVTFFVVFMERGLRKITVNYARRQGGRQGYMNQSSHLPLKLNMSGVIPPIFASSRLLLPATVANFNAGKGPEWFQWLNTQLSHGRPLFLILYLALIVFFAFFYTAIVFNPTETADNLKKHGGFIPGIRPGERTAEYIDYVLSRVTVLGAIYLAIVCLIPEILISYASVPFYFGGTSLLIVVSVTMDTVAQVQGYLLAHQYEGLIRKSKLRGRRR
jgi:preprotein translocase subunit SecY